MSYQAGGEATAAIAGSINQNFGSLEALKKEFNTASGDRFGSGWVWLVGNSPKSILNCNHSESG